ncbi:hypothetical protein [Tropicibacter sp. Alg240-R139]|uniref:hypothetical protein n=1 Tax=Tropicibacter sp. Alg240-R139 TaxID=2305991 RepID=UPI0013E082BC|nr:hypothetical protein [Tropicibacter sp. Alg240-R139]
MTDNVYEDLPRVVQIIDEYNLVLNKGGSSGIQSGDRFLVFRVGENIIDPKTGEDLGALETVVGKVRVSHLQELISTVSSDQRDNSPGRKVITRRTGGIAVLGATVEEVEENPKDEWMPLRAEIGDLAKPI